MNQYKLIFAKNEIISCDLVLDSTIEFNGDYYCEHNKGHLIFAIIKAESINEALERSEQIIKDITDKVIGKTLAN